MMFRTHRYRCQPFRRGGRGRCRGWLKAGQRCGALIPPKLPWRRSLWHSPVHQHKGLHVPVQKSVCPNETERWSDPAVAYLKKVVEAMKASGKSEDDIKKFQTGVQGYFTKVIKPNFKDYDFYVGESMDTDGM